MLKGIDRYIPVDVYIPGCPPRPEALIDAFLMLQKKIDEQALTGELRPRHLRKDAPSEFPVPSFGAHDLEPASNPAIWQAPEPELVQIAPAATPATQGAHGAK